MRKKQKPVPLKPVERLVHALPTQIYRHYGEQVEELLMEVRFEHRLGEPAQCIVRLEGDDEVWEHSDTAKLGWVRTA